MTGILKYQHSVKMRAFLFNAVASVGAFLISSIKWVSGTLTTAIGHTGAFLMKRIDGKRLAVYTKLTEELSSPWPSELDQQATELKLLAAAMQIRDHALETQDWTDNHTAHLEAIGDALVHEAGWEVDHVDRYLAEIVESIDGLEYRSE